MKVRTKGRIVSVAVIVVVGVNADGRRGVLGMDIGPSEAETFWTAFLRKFAPHGLRGVKPVISDAHEGIKVGVVAGDLAAARVVGGGDRIAERVGGRLQVTERIVRIGRGVPGRVLDRDHFALAVLGGSSSH